MSGQQIVLEEEFDENYEPTDDEVLEYARFLGMDEEHDKHLFWIARESLKAPLPADWKPCQSDEGNIYYFNFKTGESIWDHPCDEHYRQLYEREKKKAEGGAEKKSTGKQKETESKESKTARSSRESSKSPRPQSAILKTQIPELQTAVPASIPSKTLTPLQPLGALKPIDSIAPLGGPLKPTASEKPSFLAPSSLGGIKGPGASKLSTNPKISSSLSHEILTDKSDKSDVLEVDLDDDEDDDDDDNFFTPIKKDTKRNVDTKAPTKDEVTSFNSQSQLALNSRYQRNESVIDSMDEGMVKPKLKPFAADLNSDSSSIQELNASRSKNQRGTSVIEPKVESIKKIDSDSDPSISEDPVSPFIKPATSLNVKNDADPISRVLNRLSDNESDVDSSDVDRSSKRKEIKSQTDDEGDIMSDFEDEDGLSSLALPGLDAPKARSHAKKPTVTSDVATDESSKLSDFSSIQPSTKKDGGARPATTVESVVATNESNVKPAALKDGLSSTSKLASGDLKSISNIPSISSLHDKYGAGPERPPSSTKPQRDASKSPIPRSTSNLDRSKQLDTKVTSLTVDVVNPRDHLDSHDHYVEYEVVSTANIPGFDAKGDVRRRYKDFAAFRNDLTHEFPGRDFPELPPATTVQFSKDKEVIEKRRVLFSKFLRDIADDAYLHTRAKALRKFFQEATYVPAEKLPTHLNVDHVKYTALEVDVLRPQIQYDGVESYVDYEITSISKIPNFDEKGNVRRSYRDFEAFRNDLSHEFPNREFPHLPLEDAVKFSKSPEFNETCRILFAQFLKKIAEDHYLHTRSKALQKFLHDKQYQPTNEIPRPRGRNIDAAVSVTKHHDENKSSATQIAILGSSSHLKPTSVSNSNLLKVATSSEEDTQSASSHNDLISPKVKQVLGLPEEKHHVEVQGLNARTASQASLKARHLLGLPTGTSTDPHSPSGQSPGGTSPTLQKEKLHALRADLEAEWDKIEAQERAKHETDVKEIKKAYKQKLEAAEEAEEEKLRKLIKEVKAENTRSLEVLREGNEAAIQRLRLDFAEEELQIKADGEKRLALFRAADVEQREKFIAAQAAEFESYQEELKSKYRSRRMQLESEEQERYNSHARDIQSKHEAQLAVLKEKLKETQEQTLASNLTNLSELERIKYENEQESIRQKYEVQLAELKSKEQRKFESLRMEVESSTEVKQHEIKEAARKRITEEREASEKLIAAAEQDAKTKESLEKSRIQMEHSRQLDRLRLELDSELRKTDIELRQQYTLDLEALKLSSLKEADENKRRITNDHARMISILEADYARKIDDIKTKLYMGEKEEELRVIMETEQELEQRRQKVISQQREVAQLEREVEYARQRVSLEKDVLAQMERGVTTAMAREKGAYRAGLEQKHTSPISDLPPSIPRKHDESEAHHQHQHGNHHATPHAAARSMMLQESDLDALSTNENMTVPTVSTPKLKNHSYKNFTTEKIDRLVDAAFGVSPKKKAFPVKLKYESDDEDSSDLDIEELSSRSMSPISRIQRQLELNARDIRRAQKAKKKRASGKGSDSGFSELEELTKELAQKSSSLQAQLVAARAEANLNKQLALNLSKAEKDPKQEPQPTPYHIHSPYTHQTSHYHYHKAPMMLPSTVQELDTQLSNMLGRARVSKDIVNRELASIPKSPKRSHRPTKVDGYISPFTAMHQSIGAKTETFGRLHQSRPPSPSHMRPRSALAGGTGLSQWEESHNSSEAKLVQRKAWLERFIIEKNRF